MSSITVRARNFRRLNQLEWSPSGVCVLSGANGAGKTTVLSLLKFLRAVFVHGMDGGFKAVGGDHFPSRQSGDELVEFEVTVQDLRWVLKLPMSGAGLKGNYGEELYRGSEVVFRVAPYSDTGSLAGSIVVLEGETRCMAKVLYDRGESDWMLPLVNALSDIRVHDFWLNVVAGGTTREQEGVGFLHGTGRNLWAVLANWKQAPLRYQGQFEWVLSQARTAFPDLIETIEFQNGESYLYPPGATDPADGLPPRAQAAGLLTGLLLLTAVAGAKKGSVLAFDEPENQLHPYAIRHIIHALRSRAEEMGLTIILTTHSPFLLNEFGAVPGQVFVLENADGKNPIPLSELKFASWLGMYALGELYGRLTFAAPAIPPSVDEDGDSSRGR